MCSQRSLYHRGARLTFAVQSLGAVALCPSPVRAQTIIAQRHAQLGLTNTIEVDSNVLRLSDQDPTQSRRDLHLSTSLSVDVARPIGQQTVYVIGLLSYNRYPQHERLDNVTTNLQAGVDWRAGIGCVLHSGGAFARQLVKIADLSSAALAQASQSTRALVIGLNCARGPLLRPSLTYRDETVTNSAAALVQNDTSTQSYTAALGIERARLGTLALFGSYRRTRYPHHFANSPEFVRFYDAGVRLSRAVGGRIKGNATLSYNRVAPESATTRAYSGLGWTADLTLTPGGGRTHLTLGVSRATQQSTLVDISYSIDAANRISVDYALTHRLTLVSGVTLSNRTFVGNPNVAVSALGLGDRSFILSGGLRYRLPIKLLSAPVSTALDASYSRRTADNPAFNYRNVTTSFSVRVGV